jgi:hypothetical protein
MFRVLLQWLIVHGVLNHLVALTIVRTKKLI